MVFLQIFRRVFEEKINFIKDEKLKWRTTLKIKIMRIFVLLSDSGISWLFLAINIIFGPGKTIFQFFLKKLAIFYLRSQGGALLVPRNAGKSHGVSQILPELSLRPPITSRFIFHRHPRSAPARGEKIKNILRKLEKNFSHFFDNFATPDKAV